MIGPDNLAQVLGVVARRQRRRAHQIAEHHRQLPPLGLAGGPSVSGMWGVREGAGATGRSGWNWIRGRVGSAELGNGFEQHAPVAYRRHADVLQIVGRQLGQHCPIDFVVAEGRLVSLEAQSAQPCRNVQQPPPFFTLCLRVRKPAEARNRVTYNDIDEQPRTSTKAPTPWARRWIPAAARAVTSWCGWRPFAMLPTASGEISSGAFRAILPQLGLRPEELR